MTLAAGSACALVTGLGSSGERTLFGAFAATGTRVKLPIKTSTDRHSFTVIWRSHRAFLRFTNRGRRAALNSPVEESSANGSIS
jgi:hypothetical protein